MRRQTQLKGGRPRGDRDGMFDATTTGELLLKLRDSLALDQHPAEQHLLDRFSFAFSDPRSRQPNHGPILTGEARWFPECAPYSGFRDRPAILVTMPGGLGVVLSGGGARGAYEVGVLNYIFGELAQREGRDPNPSVLSGTSVGAVNGTFLASAIGETTEGVSEMVRLWEELELQDVLGFGIRQAAGLYRVLLGGREAAGIFDPRPLSMIVGRSIRWRRLRQNVKSGRISALTVTTTNVPTGHPVVFVDSAPGIGLPKGLGIHALVRQANIGQHHVLASAAIPLVFPSVEIGNELHCDGGLRLNTPMAPAIHLGMDKLLIVGLSTPHHPDDSSLEDGRYPGAPFLLGKVLNAFLLDHVNTDILEIDRINDFLRDGITAYGDGFLDKINEASKKRGALAKRRIVRSLVLRPTVDIGRVAAEHLETNRARFGKLLGRAFLGLLDVGEGADADLASYLLFDGDFAKRLIQMGRADAHERRDEIADFLFGS